MKKLYREKEPCLCFKTVFLPLKKSTLVNLLEWWGNFLETASFWETWIITSVRITLFFLRYYPDDSKIGHSKPVSCSHLSLNDGNTWLNRPDMHKKPQTMAYPWNPYSLEKYCDIILPGPTWKHLKVCEKRVWRTPPDQRHPHSQAWWSSIRRNVLPARLRNQTRNKPERNPPRRLWADANSCYKIMVVLMIFFLSFSKMNDLERASTHIYDKISSLKHLLDLSGTTWNRYQNNVLSPSYSFI